MKKRVVLWMSLVQLCHSQMRRESAPLNQTVIVFLNSIKAERNTRCTDPRVF